MIYLDGSLAGPQIVLNGRAVTVKATPRRGWLQTEHWQPPRHRANRPLPAREWCCVV